MRFVWVAMGSIIPTMSRRHRWVVSDRFFLISRRVLSRRGILPADVRRRHDGAMPNGRAAEERKPRAPHRYPNPTSVVPGGRCSTTTGDQRRNPEMLRCMHMKNLFEPSAATEIRQRMAHLRPDSERQWGKMNVAQMLAHCSAWMEWAVGLKSRPRSLVGRIFGKVAKSTVLNEKPIRRNMPTDKSLIVSDERDFEVERQRLVEWTDRFAAGGPEKCTNHPHSFFGKMTPLEWATLAYKHLDHHLRQFGV